MLLNFIRATQNATLLYSTMWNDYEKLITNNCCEEMGKVDNHKAFGGTIYFWKNESVCKEAEKQHQ